MADKLQKDPKEMPSVVTTEPAREYNVKGPLKPRQQHNAFQRAGYEQARRDTMETEVGTRKEGPIAVPNSAED